jgi:hypothetical protein
MEQGDLQLLQTVPAYHVQAIMKARMADDRFIQNAPGPFTEDLEALAAYLFEPRSCRSVLQALDDAESCMLRELVACGGRANSRDLALYLSSPGSPFATHMQEKSGSVTASPAVPLTSRQAVTGLSLYPAPHPHGAFEQALHHLLLQGLLFWGKQTNFVGRDYSSGVYDGVLIVPPTILHLAKQEWRLDELSEVVQDVVPGEEMQVLQRALYLYWAMVANARDGLPLVNSRLLSRTALRQVVDTLGVLSRFWSGQTMEQIHTENDIPYLLFLRLLLVKLHLLIEREGALYAAPARDFFALPLAERAWRCVRLWCETPFWNELAFIANVIVQPGPSPLDPAHEEVVYSRQLIVEHVVRAAPESWHALPTFIARMKLHVTYLLFPRQYGLRAERYSSGSNPYGWNFRLRRGWLTHREGWHLVEGGFIRSLICGPLYWLGVVELDEQQHPDSFRLAPGADLAVSLDPPGATETSWGRLVVQPNFDLVALAPVSEALLVDLDRFAERVRLEHIAQYRLTKASVTRAVQSDLTAEAIQHILEQAAGSSIPQNVQYSLQEWERQARRIELWRGASLLEVDNPVFLDALFADEATRSWLLRRLAPTLAEVASEHLAQLQEVLWQHDYLPTLVSASQHQDLLVGAPLPAHEAQWVLTPDGLLTPCYPLTNLYLATELERIASADELTGERRITPASLQQALASGLALDSIIRFLQHYCLGGVPGSFLIRLKLWGHGYTAASSLHVESSPLLSLSDQALQDLLADEEIGPLLGSSVPAEKRLVRVSSEYLEQVISLLRERGFDVS